MVVSDEVKIEITELIKIASRHLMEFVFLEVDRTSAQILPYLRFHDRTFNDVYSLAYDAVVHSCIMFDEIDKYYGHDERLDALLDLWRNGDIEAEAIGLYMATCSPENFELLFSGYLKNYSNFEEIIDNLPRFSANPPRSVTSSSKEISDGDFVDRCINKFHKDFMEQLYGALAEDFDYLALDDDSIFENDSVAAELEHLSSSLRLNNLGLVDTSIDHFRIVFLEQLYEELAVEFDDACIDDAISIAEDVAEEQLDELSSNLKYCLENDGNYPDNLMEQSSSSLDQESGRAFDQASIGYRKIEVEALIEEDFNKYQDFIDENILKKGKEQKIKKRKSTD